MLPPVGIEPSPHSPFWTKLTFACKAKTLGSLYSHAQLILTKSSNKETSWLYAELKSYISFQVSFVAYLKLSDET